MDISFITVNYNSSDETLNLIKSIHQQTQNSSYEIIVVDNDSRPQELEKLNELKSDPYVKLIESPVNGGFAKGNMLGVEQAKGRHYFFLNNDTRLLNDASGILKAFLEANSKIALATAQLYHDEESPTSSYKKFPTLANKLFGNSFVRFFTKDDFPSNKVRLYEPTKVGVVSGSCMFFNASVFNQLGGLDTNFFLYCEEEDISKRIWESGYEVYFVPEAKIVHYEGASTQKSYEIEREYYISYNILLNKHFSPLTAAVMKFFVLLKLLRRSFRGGNYFRLFRFVLRGAPVKESLRHRQQTKEVL
ncbi:MAG: glycosyltransferase family 2 protein [Campylobacterota bacterium]